MKKLARLFLLCMMILAIPVQGVAAATMLYCGTEHHHASVSDQDQHEQHEHHHDAAEKLSHHSPHSDAAAKLSKDKCSSCAACCIGAAMVTESLIQNSPSPSSEKIDLVFSSHFGHISDGLERPPRA
ncbi:hypothetical protein LPB67_14950 [Undibacterium sp. Jales W-56]|uniref:hypothetical protein n=1 Tax=Undibacterium sp. Jales W-56 TaxID=2897325 RepID=UPI0021D1CA9B|nr:hypothetical protein [Undibacterium sp. Jales W-56]MCU6435074.1 hypothetical protein [Undibacterium sp. Jales W-56]